MSSENVGLLVVGAALISINAVLGGPIAAGIAAFFARMSPPPKVAQTPTGVDRPHGGDTKTPTHSA